MLKQFYLLLSVSLLSLNLFGQSPIVTQGFEAGDTWTISSGSANISSATGSGDTPANQRIRTGSNSWQVNNESATLDLSSVDVSSYESIKIIAHISSTAATSGNGADGGDNMQFFVNVDGGGFPGTADVSISGNSNAKWGYTANLTASTAAGTPVSFSAPQSGTNDNNYTTIEITVPNGTSTVELRVTGLNNSGNEIWNLDDIVLEGTVATTDTRVQFSAATSSLTEDGLLINIPVSISNPSASTATTVEIALNGASTATNGTDYDDGAGTPMAISFPQTLTFPANSSADQNLTVYISVDDTDIEPDETVILFLQNPSGGTNADLGGITTHTLTILDNDIPNLVINEIMYNTPSTDDEWVEIFNPEASTIDLENYTLEYNGSTFTFPSGATIAPSSYITIALGSNGDGIYNNDNPFTPTYSAIGPSPATTNNSNNLPNSTATITLKMPSGTTIDEVTYDDGSPWPTNADGDGPSLELTDPTSNNNIGSSWFAGGDGGTPGAMNLLPVELIFFKGEKISNMVELKWETASEINNQAVIVERKSSNGDYRALTTILGTGDSYTNKQYVFLDRSPAKTINYYRLKQVDFDGTFSYSKTISIDFRENSNTRIYPTLASDFINLKFEEILEGERTIQVINLNGAVVDEFKIEGDDNFKSIDVTQLISGHYFLKIQSGAAVQSHQFVKQ